MWVKIGPPGSHRSKEQPLGQQPPHLGPWNSGVAGQQDWLAWDLTPEEGNHELPALLRKATDESRMTMGGLLAHRGQSNRGQFGD